MVPLLSMFEAVVNFEEPQVKLLEAYIVGPSTLSEHSDFMIPYRQQALSTFPDYPARRRW